MAAYVCSGMDIYPRLSALDTRCYFRCRRPYWYLGKAYLIL